MAHNDQSNQSLGPHQSNAYLHMVHLTLFCYLCGPLDLGILHAPGQGFSTDLSNIIGFDDINPLVNDDLKNYCFHGERKKEIIFESVNQPNYTSV